MVIGPSSGAATTPSRDELFRILDAVMDPEVPVLSIVELGIVRDARVEGDGVTIIITPTYSGCPAMHVIEAEILRALREHGIDNARLETVYAPAWTTDWMSDVAKEKLRAYGIAPPGRADSSTDLVPLLRRAEAVRCPYCGSMETDLRSEFGSTACKSILYCRECRQPFEGFKAI
jgi:ring-1,2-phenylacetyl-CoA epoxidase subunit PaaD